MFLSVCVLIRIAVQVIIKPWELHSSVQVESLSSYSGYMSRRSCAAFFLPFSILDKSFCVFLQSLTNFLLTEKCLVASLLFVLSAKAVTWSLKLAFSRHDSKRKRQWGDWCEHDDIKEKMWSDLKIWTQCVFSCGMDLLQLKLSSLVAFFILDQSKQFSWL